MQAFTRVDVQTGETQTWFPGIRCFCEELVFVPGPKAATEETDGFLLGMVYDAARHQSFLAVSSSATYETSVDLFRNLRMGVCDMHSVRVSATCKHLVDLDCNVHKEVWAVPSCVEHQLGVIYCMKASLLQLAGPDRDNLCIGS